MVPYDTGRTIDAANGKTKVVFFDTKDCQAERLDKILPTHHICRR